MLVAVVACAAALVAPGAADAMGSSRTAALQIGLQAKGLYGGTIDGLWGAATERAVRILQRRNGLTVDGVVGPATRRALDRYGRPGLGSRLVHTGLVGWDVSRVQFLLAWHGFPSGTFDGSFGERTRSAVLRFQRFERLASDGVVGSATIRALLGPIPRSPYTFSRPVSAPIGDRFGPRGNRFHTGLDFPADYGVAVRAARRGRVVAARWDSGGYGNLVVIGHGRRVRTWYAHLSRIRVSRGQRVDRGARIGTVGATGHATGPHLHWEVRRRGAALNPLPALR
jgi:murein DD-endopeptidase MepM/ murein hydrolase activator NlpD